MWHGCFLFIGKLHASVFLFCFSFAKKNLLKSNGNDGLKTEQNLLRRSTQSTSSPAPKKKEQLLVCLYFCALSFYSLLATTHFATFVKKEKTKSVTTSLAIGIFRQVTSG